MRMKAALATRIGHLGCAIGRLREAVVEGVGRSAKRTQGFGFGA
jgi:hypothetical protein